MKFKSWFCSDS